jgi:putative endonuclease
MTRPPLADRSARGRAAEDAVADYLVAHGYRILFRNVRLGALELDVVARRGDLAAIVEVRTRGPGALEGPFESVSPTKRKRLRRAARRLWGERLRAMPGVQRVRLDVAAVYFDEDGRVRVELVEGAIASET